MPVYKFRSLEEMKATPPPLRLEGGFDRFLRHCARYRSLNPRTLPRGVFRFLTIEEAQDARAALRSDRHLRERLAQRIDSGDGIDRSAELPAETRPRR